MKSNNFLYTQMFIALLLFSANGIFVKSISFGPTIIVAHRAIIAAIVLGIYLHVRKSLQPMTRKEIGLNILFGLLLTAHWLTLFESIKISTVAIAMASLYTFPVFTAIAEPLINKKPIQRKDIWLSLLILLGIVIMVPEWNIQNTMMQGVLLGVSSSLIYIYRNIGIRKHLSHINSSQLVYGQVIVVSLCLLPILMQSTFTYEAFDIPLLLAIGIGVTAFSHSVFAQSIQVLSAKTASIIFSAQPLLATIIAFFVLNEVPTWQTVIGGMCILVAVYMEVVQIKA